MVRILVVLSIFISSHNWAMNTYKKVSDGNLCKLIRQLHQKKPWKNMPQELVVDIMEKNIVNRVSNFDVPTYYYVFEQQESIICSYYLTQKGDVVWLQDKKNKQKPKEFYLHNYIQNFPKKVRRKISGNKKDLKFVSYNNASKILLAVWGVKNLFAGVWQIKENNLKWVGCDWVSNIDLLEEENNCIKLQFSEQVKKIQVSFPIQR